MYSVTNDLTFKNEIIGISYPDGADMETNNDKTSCTDFILNYSNFIICEYFS